MEFLKKWKEADDDMLKQIAEFKQIEHYDEKSNLERKYSYYYPNREFSGRMEDIKLKKIDDGTFIDNGYR